MAYRIEFSPDVEGHLRALSKRQQSTLFDAVEQQLLYEPTVETRNRKAMRPNPLAGWELLIGDLRVYYDVDTDRQIVQVHAVGLKLRNVVRIGGREVQL